MYEWTTEITRQSARLPDAQNSSSTHMATGVDSLQLMVLRQTFGELYAHDRDTILDMLLEDREARRDLRQRLLMRQQSGTFIGDDESVELVLDGTFTVVKFGLLPERVRRALRRLYSTVVNSARPDALDSPSTKFRIARDGRLEVVFRKYSDSYVDWSALHDFYHEAVENYKNGDEVNTETNTGGLTKLSEDAEEYSNYEDDPDGVSLVFMTFSRDCNAVFNADDANIQSKYLTENGEIDVFRLCKDNDVMKPIDKHASYVRKPKLRLIVADMTSPRSARYLADF